MALNTYYKYAKVIHKLGVLFLPFPSLWQDFHWQSLISSQHLNSPKYSLEYLENNIKAIITAAKHYKLNHSNTDLPDYLYLPAHDQTDFDLTIYFEQSYSFIDKCLKYTNVLVHCVAGISRSASIVVAYLMRKL